MKKAFIIISLFASSLSYAAPLVLAGPQVGSVEVAFAHKGGAEELLVRLIRRAKDDVQVMTHSFSSPAIVDALLKARRRGVMVSVAVDSSNLENPAGLEILKRLHAVGTKIRTVGKNRITNDKLLIVDGKHVKFGATNLQQAVDRPNRETATVFWDSPELADVYFKLWRSNWNKGNVFSL
jgi:phosphatidylserine/phosphatidylglycerophosphate/cardiolipin synthase-like enzyme